MQSVTANRRSIHLPDSRDGCGGLQAFIERESVAIDDRKWNIAMIIFSWCTSRKVDRDGLHGGLSRFTLAEFAALGFPGLEDEETVRHYYDAARKTCIQKGIPGMERDMLVPVSGTPFPVERNKPHVRELFKGGED